MFLDVLDKDNYGEFNITAAKLFGLDTAVYFTVIAQIAAKALKKDKVNDGFVTLDRDYIEERTTLDKKKQYKCDATLTKAGVLMEDEQNPDMIRLNAKQMVAILCNDDPDTLKDLAKAKKGSTETAKAKKQEGMVLGLSRFITETDQDVKAELVNWIRILAESTRINKVTIENFQSEMNRYSTDKNTKLAIIKIAQANTYREFAWAQQIYEKTKKPANGHLGEQKRATSLDTSLAF